MRFNLQCLANSTGCPPEPDKEDEIRYTPEYLSYAFQAAGMGAWQWAPSTDALILSHPARQLMGLEPDTTPDTGNELLARVHAEDRPRVQVALRRAVEDGSEYHEDFRLVRPDGDEMWIAHKGRVWPGEAGTPDRMSGVLIDITERKQAEAESQRALARVHSVLSSITEAHFVLDAEFRLIEANPAALHLLFRDLSIGELIGQRFWDVLPEDTEFLQQYHHAMEEQRAIHFEGRSMLVDRWFETHAYPRQGLLEVYMRDITDRKRAEQALATSEHEFRAFFELASAGSVVRDPATGRFVRVNQRFCEITGYSRAELMERTFLDITHPEDRGRERELIESALRGETCEWVCEKRCVRRDGSIAWVVVAGRLLRDAGGRPLRIISTLFDITTRKQAEDALRESETRLKMALEAGRMITWIWDLETGEIATSENLAQLTGSAQPSLAYDDWMALVHPEDRESLFKITTEAIDSGATFYGHEVRTVMPDGRLIWFATQAKVLRDPQGEAIRLAGVSFDVTERKHAEAALKEADRRKNEFLATLAHELRNPLAPIRNALHLLRLQGDPESKTAWARDVIDRQARHLARLVDDLLDVSRITRGKIELRKERIELAAVLEQAIETSRPLIEAQGHELTVSLPSEPVALEADMTRLAQIVGNLLNNAAKYTPERGHIWLAGDRRGDEAVIRVRDTGIGISPQVLPHVFDMFSQAESSIDRAHGGLGIGLTIVKSLVELHGGTMEVHSAGLGRGSEFVVRLPAESSDRATQPHEGEAGAGEPREELRSATSRVVRVLVVDDNRDAADSLGMLLSSLGYEVRVAHNGPTGLEQAMGCRPDVMILDLGMPGMSGYEVAHRVRRAPELRDVHLVALTGWGQAEDRRRTREVGFDHHLVKPVDPSVLRELLASLRPKASSGRVVG